jgi:hypothetical protein
MCARAAAVFSYIDRDAILYALSVGVSLDALDPSDLKFTYELHPEGQTVLPTFAVLFGFGAMGSIMDVSLHSLHTVLKLLMITSSSDLRIVV